MLLILSSNLQNLAPPIYQKERDAFHAVNDIIQFNPDQIILRFFSALINRLSMHESEIQPLISFICCGVAVILPLLKHAIPSAPSSVSIALKSRENRKDYTYLRRHRIPFLVPESIPHHVVCLRKEEEKDG